MSLEAILLGGNPTLQHYLLPNYLLNYEYEGNKIMFSGIGGSSLCYTKSGILSAK